jgi:bla regulator protein BlaR1
MIPAAFVPLASHIWQSTLFAAVAGLLTLALRRNQARVRYWLWVAASYKFLLPFSWLVSIGRQFEWRTAPAVMPHAFSAVADMVSGPIFLSALPAAKPAPDQLPVLLLVIWAVWACGFTAVAVGWAREWLRIRAIVRAASPLSLGLPIRVVSTSARLEPGVFGLFHPFLLLPEGIAARLTPAQLQAVIAHELCHVRRRDNLVAAVHMFVEALFWFHPLVWWLGARMIDERERACDEEVLQAGSQAQAYAESILKVCEFYLESPMRCVSGVTGAYLKRRIQRITTKHIGVAVSTQKKWLLATAAVTALAQPIVVGVLTAPRLRAQSPAVPAWQTAGGGKMAFDVASVKPTQTRGRPTSNVPLIGDAYAPTGGLFSATNTSLMNYLRFAFKDIKLAYQATPDLAAAPAWIRTGQYDIEARAQGHPTKDQLRLMMQSLLEERFRLAVHYEKRKLPLYALVLAKEGKTGAQLKPDDGTCSITTGDVQAINTAPQLPPASSPAVTSPIPQIPCGILMPVPASMPGRMRIAGRKVTLAFLAEMASAPVTGVDRPVFDHTGLGGTYDISFEFSPRPNGPLPPGFAPDDAGPTFFEALQDQLGLRLVPQAGPVDVLVVDRIEQPSEN